MERIVKSPLDGLFKGEGIAIIVQVGDALYFCSLLAVGYVILVENAEKITN